MKEKTKNIIEQRMDSLFSNFSYFVKVYYDKEKFLGPSFYFYKKVIDTIRTTNNYKKLKDNNIFFEYMYAALTSWGMHRMDQGALLQDFDLFKKNIINEFSTLEELSHYKLSEFDNLSESKIKALLTKIVININIMRSSSKLVGDSKAFHFLLPDLIPPMDRKNIIKFFYNRDNYKKEEEVKIFLEILDKFCFINKKLNLDQNNFTGCWDTSIPKIIDNAIIGYFIETKQSEQKVEELIER